MATTKVTTDVIDMSGNAGGLTWVKGTTAEREAAPSTGVGNLRENTDTKRTEIYTDQTGTSEWRNLKESAVVTLEVDYLVIAGGGGGGGNNSGGGGAGGYLTSYDSDRSGDNSATLTALSLSTGAPGYTVTVGAGGAGVASGIGSQNGGIGLDSVFATLTANGGGCGRASGGAVPGEVDGGSGGGGAYGAAAGQTKGAGTPLQGGDGDDGVGGGPSYNGGGGGGASGDASGINGANGLVSTIDGGTTTRAGGGGGGQDPNSPSSGGTGGGGTGGTQSFNAGVGTVNTGSGGGGGGYETGSSGGAGGKGLVILRYPDIFSITVGAGLVTGVLNTAIGSSDKYTTFTSGTDTITFN